MLLIVIVVDFRHKSRFDEVKKTSDWGFYEIYFPEGSENQWPLGIEAQQRWGRLIVQYENLIFWHINEWIHTKVLNKH